MDWERSPIGLAGEDSQNRTPRKSYYEVAPSSWSHATYRLPPVFLIQGPSKVRIFRCIEPLARTSSFPLAYFPLQTYFVPFGISSMSLKRRVIPADRQSTCKICITSFVCKLGNTFRIHGLDRRGRDGRASFPTRTCSYIVSISPFAGHSASTIPPALCPIRVFHAFKGEVCSMTSYCSLFAFFFSCSPSVVRPMFRTHRASANTFIALRRKTLLWIGNSSGRWSANRVQLAPISVTVS